MQFLRKRLILLLVIFVIYGAYFITHFHTNNSSHVLGVTNNLVLFEQPRDGKDPIISAIDNAQKEIDVEVYLLSDKDVIASLLSACNRGVAVSVMLEEYPFGGGNVNTKTNQQLQNSCVRIEWTSSAFSLTHEKTIVIDNKEVFILNQNLTAAAFKSNREYDILDGNLQDVAEIHAIFMSDWDRKNPNLADDNLVISPINSRDKLFGLISSATRSINIETEVIDDPNIIQLLSQKAAHMPVEIIIPTYKQVSSNKKAVALLESSGAKVEAISSPYIHAKLILVDSAKAYIGSVNLTTQSMDSNREVGIILSQQDIVSSLIGDFSTDWQSGLSL